MTDNACDVALKTVPGASRCPNCSRHVVPGRRHKERLGRDAPWCDGLPRPTRDRALDLLCRVHSYACDLHFAGRDGELIAFLSPLERFLPAPEDLARQERSGGAFAPELRLLPRLEDTAATPSAGTTRQPSSDSTASPEAPAPGS